MIALPESSFVTPEDYLKWEEKQEIKHEYRDGEIYAMAGASDAHVTISLNIASLLRNHVRGSNCRVYMSDMKVRLETANRFYYPDVLVTCDAKDQENNNYKCYPKVIIEVLSDSTEAFDRGDKFIDYQSLNSLEEYVLINTKHQRIESFRKNAQGLWVLEVYHADCDGFSIKSINFQGFLTEIYEDVSFNQ
ncbi:Uma2 family endonuclease [Cyanothece sp. BG0011]|uniref:Uma2 family endonuclease n=1 Tax=Cyanothece sp. BG0011 TaxID=2082950 RepID=UPI000D1EF4B4|nr:Uma2 family endonuclease [Cyanothece sp. BG0011]